MKAKFVAFAVGLLSAAVPMLAHHSFSAEFDNSKPVSLQGTVTKVDWLNPHIWIYMDVKDEKTGAVTSWQCEGGAPNSLDPERLDQGRPEEGRCDQRHRNTCQRRH